MEEKTTKPRKPGSGGARPDAGRKAKEPTQKKQTYQVYLLPEQREYLIKEFKSLTKAIETLLPKYEDHTQLTKLNKNLSEAIQTLLPKKAP